MNQANTILLSLDADAAIASVSSSVGISPDMVLQQAQTYVQATLGTKLLNEPIEIDDESIMAKQLGHFSCEWIRWTKGTLRETLKTNPNIELVQVVAIRAQEFNELPPREFLPELPGGNFFHERPSKPPSNGAKPTEFSDSQADPKTRIRIDRPREPGNTSTNIKNIAPSDPAMLFATKMANELCVIFRDEQEREQIFFNLKRISRRRCLKGYTIGDSKTDGGVFHKYTAIDKDGAARLLVKVKLEQTGTSDPCFQVSSYYLENTRQVRQNVLDRNEEAAAWVRTRLPSILISHPGPNIQILGGVMTDPRSKFSHHLCPCITRYYHVSNQDLFLGFARTLTALNVLFVDLGKLYDNPPPLNPFLPVQHVYPYSREFKCGNQVVTFTYLKRIDLIRLVSEVETEKDILYIKYTPQYGAEAHRKAHKLGIAPELLAYDDKAAWRLELEDGSHETDSKRLFGNR
ncbi:hypothetical protein GG344DRAFT_76791 [Lentinula edodes]|nr:hypothetical protein GG344DRAFT_76791 [Lentinula edodes]